MKKIFIVVVATLLSSPIFAQEPDAVFKLLRQEWTVNADGTSDYHYRHEVQILRNRALTAYADLGETFVVYNPDFEELTVNEVYTIRKDGSRVEMPQNAFVYQLPSQCADCGRFNHIRELAMVHTGMELGCIIVVDYTIHRHYDLVSCTLDLVQRHPIERLEVNISVPDGQDLRVKLNDPKVIAFNPSIAQTELSYRLKANDVPQTYVDNYLPEKESLYPTLRFYNGTPEFVPAFDTKGLVEARSATGKAMTGDNEVENIVLLRNYVVDNIHLNDLNPAMLGYKHATAAEVWQTGCGTATDKAVLLAAILNQWGYAARVIGEQSDEVGVVVDTLEYRLSVRNKTPMMLYGEAKDEVNKQNIKTTVNATLDTLEGGFFRLQLPSVPGGPNISAARLALVRTAPVQSSACELKSDIVVKLPAGVKLVGGNVKQSLRYDGVGSVEVSIKQSGKNLRVVRNMTLEKSVIEVGSYSAFRQLLTLWQDYSDVLLRVKK